MDDLDECGCGHIYDEHSIGGEECAVDGCECLAFELFAGEDDEDNEEVENGSDRSHQQF